MKRADDMADHAGFERRLYGSPHMIRWREEDIRRFARHFDIADSDIPSEADVWRRQRERRIASAAFIVEGPLREPIK
jgi:hypothetical protein